MQKFSKSDQAEITKTKLLAISRRYFTKHGYVNTASEDIVAASQVTRGALYHHFNGKEGLFTEVLKKMLLEINSAIDSELRPVKDPFEKLLAFCRAYVKCLNKPDVLQISLIDAPTVIGWHHWNELNEQYSLATLLDIIEELVEDRVLKPYPPQSLTHLLSGGMHDIVLWATGQKHPDIALAEAEAGLEEMLLSLKVENWEPRE